MNYCSKCGGMGTTVNGKFCTCTEGRFKKAEHEAKLKAELKRADEAKKTAKALDKKAAATAPKVTGKQMALFDAGPDQQQKKDKGPLTYFEVGDWVQVKSNYGGGGSVGYVVDVDTKDDTYKVHFIRYGKRGEPMSKYKWVDEEAVKPYTLPKEENDLLAMVDLALKTYDEDWFNELFTKLP